MFGKKKRLQGIQLIDEVTGRFTSMIDELDEGVDNCQEERRDIYNQISLLTQRDTILAEATGRAERLVVNIKSLMSK